MFDGFPAQTVKNFHGLNTKSNPQDISPQEAIIELNTIFFPGGIETRPGMTLKGTPGLAGTVQHVELVWQITSGGATVKHWLILTNNGGTIAFYDWDETTLTALISGLPAGTTHFRVAAYFSRYYISFSDGVGGKTTPYVFDPTWSAPKMVPMGFAKFAASPFTVTPQTGGGVTVGWHLIQILIETRSGFITRPFIVSLAPMISGGSVSPSQKATSTLTSTGVFSNGETVWIDTGLNFVQYTFRTALSAPSVPYEVLIGADQTASHLNLLNAINRGPGEGVTYSSNLPHPTVIATSSTGTTTVIQAKESGGAGNLIPTSETCANASWSGTTMGGGSAATGTLRITGIPTVTASWAPDGNAYHTVYRAHITKYHVAMTQVGLQTYYIAATANAAADGSPPASIDVTVDDLTLVSLTEATPYMTYRNTSSVDTQMTMPGAIANVIYHDRHVMIGDYQNRSIFVVSETGAPENFVESTGFGVVSRDDGQRVSNLFFQGNNLYLTKQRALWATEDTGGTPDTWPLYLVADGVGTESASGVATDTDNGVAWILDPKGLYVFAGGAPGYVSEKIAPTWQAFNAASLHTAEVVYSPSARRVYCLLSKSVAASMLVLDTTTPKIRKWSLWSFQSNELPQSIVIDPSTGPEQLTFWSLDWAYRLDDASLSDLQGGSTAIAISFQHRTFAFAPRNHGLQLFAGLTAYLEGTRLTTNVSTISRSSNVVTVNTSGAHGLSTGDYASLAAVVSAALSFNGVFLVTVTTSTQFTFSQVGPDESGSGGTSSVVVVAKILDTSQVQKFIKALPLSPTPSRDATVRFNVRTERAFVDLSLNKIGSRVTVSQLSVYSKPSAYRNL